MDNEQDEFEELKKEFEEWFTKLLVDWKRNQACYWRGVLLGCKADLFKEHLRQNKYAKNFISSTNGIIK